MNPVTRTELAKQLNCSRSTVSSHLKKHIAHNPALAHDIVDNLLGSKLQYLIGHSIKHGFEQFLIDEETEKQALLSDEERKENFKVAKNVAAIRATFRKAYDSYHIRSRVFNFIRNEDKSTRLFLIIWANHTYKLSSELNTSSPDNSAFVFIDLKELRGLGENGHDALLSIYENASMLNSELIKKVLESALVDGLWDLRQGRHKSYRYAHLSSSITLGEDFYSDEMKQDVVTTNNAYREY